MITSLSDTMLQNRDAFKARAAFSARLAGGQAQFDVNALDCIQTVTPIEHVEHAEKDCVDGHQHTAKPKINYSALWMLLERQDFATLLSGKKGGASILEGKSASKADSAAQSRAKCYLLALGEKFKGKKESNNAAAVQAESFMAAYGNL